MRGPVYQFADFCLDCGRFELLKNDRAVSVERKPMELLILLVSREGELVTRAEIAERLWSSEVFVDTEHGINTAVRKIRYVLRDDPERSLFIQTVTGKGYRFVSPLFKAPLSTVELDVEDKEPGSGIEAPGAAGATTLPEAGLADVVGSAPAAGQATRRLEQFRWWLAGFVALVLILGILAGSGGFRFLGARVFHRNSQPPITSLAVIPLDNLSGDPNQEYFADGMTDELITMLAKDSTLRIPSRTSVMHFKSTHMLLPEIARALNVDAVVEGSVSRSENRVHMTLQLIRADTDTHLWAERYDRDESEVAALPNEAAQAIARRLNSAVETSAPARYVKPEAHDAYLHGMYLWYHTSNEETGRYFRKAVEIQPDYARGWAGVSLNYGAGAVGGELDPRRSLPEAKQAAAKALQLDDSLPEAHLAMGAAIFISDWDFARADREIQRAIELDPKFADAYHFRARMYQAFNRHEESIDVQKKSTELDPYARPWGMAQAYYAARRYDDVLADLRLRLESDGRQPDLLDIMHLAYHAKGMDKEAVQTLVTMYQSSGQPAHGEDIQRAYRQGGYKGVVRDYIAEKRHASSPHYVSPVDMALNFAELGDREQTLALLEAAYNEHSPRLLWIQNYRAYDFLHSDARYRELVRKMGLPPAY